MTDELKNLVDLLVELADLRAAIEPKRMAMEEAQREHRGACDAASYVERQITEMHLVGPNVNRRVIAMPNSRVGVIEFRSGGISQWTDISIVQPEIVP